MFRQSVNGSCNSGSEHTKPRKIRMLLLSGIERDTLRLERQFRDYGISKVSDFIDTLTDIAEEHVVREVFVGSSFFDSLETTDIFFVLEALADFSHLRKVTLIGGILPVRGLCAFLRPGCAARASLHVLCLEHCQLLMTLEGSCFEEIQDALSHHPLLEEFSLIDFDVVDDERICVAQDLNGLIKALSSLSKLRILRLEASSRELVAVDGNSMKTLFAAVKLVELSLGYLAFTKMHTRMLVWGIRKEPVRKLSLKFVHLRDDDLAKLAFYLKSCQKLQELDLSGNLFGNAGAKTLADELSQSPSIKSLVLLHNEKIGKEGYKSLANLVDRNKSISTLLVPPNAPYRDVMELSLENNRSNIKAALAA